MEIQQHARAAPGGFRFVTYWAWKLDRLLNRRIGAAYRVVLSIGLGVSIAASWKSLITAFHTTANLLVIIGTVAFQIALLINQLAQVHQRRQARIRRRAVRRAV